MIARDNIAPDASTKAPSRWPILLIVLLGAALRLIALDRVPPAIGQDEAVNAYDAFCILKTGTDHYGTPWPVFFRSFGDYHPGPPIYLQIPFQMLLGLNVWSARLPDALFGAAHVLFAYLLVRRFYGERVGLLAAGLLALSPWHIHLTRLAFGIGTALSLTTLGLLLIVRRLSGDPGRMRATVLLELAGAGLALGVALWTYHSMRIVVPLLLAGGALLSRRRLWALARSPRGRLAMVGLAGGFLVGIGPFVWTWVRAPDQVWARAASLSLFGQAPHWVEAIKMMMHNYAAHFAPSFLFLEGDLSLVQSIPGYGQLHHAYFLFLPLGLYRLIRNWRAERFGRFVLWWILIAPIPASLTRLDLESGHCLRAAGVLPAYDILAAMGIDLLVQMAGRRIRRAVPWVLAATLAPIVAGAAYFEYQFHARYPEEAAIYFNAEWGPVIEEIARRQADYDAVMITSLYSGHIGIQYLFWSKMDPAAYFQVRPNIVSGDHDFLIQVGTIFFASAQRLNEVAAILRPGSRLLVAERPGIGVPGVVLKEFLDSKGNPDIILYAVRTAGSRRASSATQNRGG